MKKILTLLLIILSVSPAYSAEVKATGTVKATALRMRAGAGVRYEIIGTIKKNTPVIITEEKDGWYAIAIPAEADAWVARKYIQSNGIVNKDAIRVRSGPNIVYSPIGVLEKGDRVKIIDKSNSHWYKIQPPATSLAWVKADFIEIDKVSEKQTDDNSVSSKSESLDDLFGNEKEESGENFENYEIILSVETLIIDEKELSRKTDNTVNILRKRLQAAKIANVHTHRLTAGTILVHFDSINSKTLEKLQELLLRRGNFSLHAVHEERPNGPKKGGDKNFQILPYRFQKKNQLLINSTDEIKSPGGIIDAYTSTHEFGRISIKFSLNEKAAYEYTDITGRFLKKTLAYVLDGEVLAAPIIQNISSENGSFSGDFNAIQARNIAIMLRYGALPVDLKIKSQQEHGTILARIKPNEVKIAPAEEKPVDITIGHGEKDPANEDILKLIPEDHTSYTGYLVPVRPGSQVDFALAKKVNGTYLAVCYIQVQKPISKEEVKKFLYQRISISGKEKYLSGWAKPLLYLDDYNPVK